MSFMLYQLGGRLLGLCVIFYCVGVLRQARRERTIKSFHGWVHKRDGNSFMYWATFSWHVFYLFCGCVLALFGWFHPGS